MAILDRNRAPPPHYYADRIAHLLAGVEQQYSDLLSAEEHRLLHTFRGLSSDGQRLLARIVSRRGPLLRIDTLHYPELESPPAAVAELAARELIVACPCSPADQHLEALRVAEIHALFPRRPRVPKRTLIDTVAGRYTDTVIRRRVQEAHPLVEFAHRACFDRLQLLYFGEGNDLSTFVLEDLGVFRFERYALDPRYRQFPDRATFDRYLSLGELRSAVQRLEETWIPAIADRLLCALGASEPSRLIERRRTGLLNRLGRTAERAGSIDTALRCYAVSGRPPARERTVRLLASMHDEHALRSVLDEMKVAPRSASEAKFACDYRKPRAKRSYAPPETRLKLRGPPEDGVERAALVALTHNHGTGRHLENLLPLGMLGLAFWDVIFAPVEGAFTHPYQDRPLDLYWKDFRHARDAAIAVRLAEIRCRGRLSATVQGNWHNRHGTRNALVNWSAWDVAFLDLLLATVPALHWRVLFDHMLDDLDQARTGFPDLTILYGRNRYEWVEVKGPGDQLRREQRVWFDFFAAAGLSARVLRVYW